MHIHSMQLYLSVSLNKFISVAALGVKNIKANMQISQFWLFFLFFGRVNVLDITRICVFCKYSEDTHLLESQMMTLVWFVACWLTYLIAHIQEDIWIILCLFLYNLKSLSSSEVLILFSNYVMRWFGPFFESLCKEEDKRERDY